MLGWAYGLGHRGSMELREGLGSEIPQNRFLLFVDGP